MYERACAFVVVSRVARLRHCIAVDTQRRGKSRTGVVCERHRSVLLRPADKKCIAILLVRVRNLAGDRCTVHDHGRSKNVTSTNRRRHRDGKPSCLSLLYYALRSFVYFSPTDGNALDTSSVTRAIRSFRCHVPCLFEHERKNANRFEETREMRRRFG